MGNKEQYVSQQKVQYNTLLVVFMVLFFLILMIVLDNNLICVDENGCLLEQCSKFAFNPSYTTLIAQSKAGNGNCLF